MAFLLALAFSGEVSTSDFRRLLAGVMAIFSWVAVLAGAVGLAAGALGGAVLVPAIRRWGGSRVFTGVAAATTFILGLFAFPWIPLGATVSGPWEVVVLKVLPAAFGAAATAWHVRTAGSRG